VPGSSDLNLLRAWALAASGSLLATARRLERLRR
jgi:hypothetical protein